MGFLAAIPAAMGIGAGAAGAAGAGAGAAAGAGAGMGLSSFLGSAAAAPVTGAAVGAGAPAAAGMSTAGVLSTAGPFLSAIGGLTGDKSMTGIGSVASSGGKLMKELGDMPLTETLKLTAQLGSGVGDMFGGAGGGNEPQQQQQTLPGFKSPDTPTTRMLSAGSNQGYQPTAYRTSQAMFGR